MSELKIHKKYDKKYRHWIACLLNYKNHPINQVLKDFSSNIPEFLLSSYLHIGELQDSKNIKKDICILHYNSELNGHTKFMDIQNLESYKNLFELNPKLFTQNEIIKLGLTIDRESVIDMSDPDALSIWHLDKIYMSRYFFITDETGYIKEYNWEC